MAAWDNYNRCFRARQEATPTDEASPTTPAASPGITITDLAQFAPTPRPLSTEPDAVGVAGLPVNFTASAARHVQSGTLLGTALTVRFTPVAYDYDYGDGSSRTLTTPGRTWADLGQEPFTPTPTSHTYAAAGTYTVRLSIRYAAEIDTGTGWTPVAGTLTSAPPPLILTIHTARTALVAHTCTERPTAPGC